MLEKNICTVPITEIDYALFRASTTIRLEKETISRVGGETISAPHMEHMGIAKMQNICMVTHSTTGPDGGHLSS